VSYIKRIKHVEILGAMPLKLLAFIFQQSYDTSQVPSDWQFANVTAVFKKGEKTNPANYRPVSLTISGA
jgi:hypothetical protein